MSKAKQYYTVGLGGTKSKSKSVTNKKTGVTKTKKKKIR